MNFLVQPCWAVRWHIIMISGLLILSSVLLASDSKEKSDEAERHFLQKVQPLLTSRCYACHGAEKADGGLRLDSRVAVLAGGDSGPSVLPGKPTDSLLLQAVKQSHAVLKMPPKQKLSTRDVETIERWIRDGVPWPASRPEPPLRSDSPTDIGDAWRDPRNPIAHLFGGQRLDLWSLKPVHSPQIPAVKQSDWPVQSLDHFVLATFETNGVVPRPEADPRTLVRRLSFDLIGLPPTSEQVAQFESQVKRIGMDRAISQLVDELLDRPQFGEHWARRWLDVVRYSDSNGFDWDEFRPQAWRFRDYVVRSFNSDKPFDQFIREQLAGDELFEGSPRTSAQQDSLLATGYLRLGPHDNAAGLFNEQDRSRAELLADVTETTSTAFLGLTFNCCRCHDHKYDPISQADHYRLRAFFAAIQFADNFPLNLAEEQEKLTAHNEQLEARIKPLREQHDALPESNPEGRTKVAQQIKELEAMRRPSTHGLIVTDNKNEIAATHVFFQGDHKAPRDAVEPGFLSIFDPRSATIAASQNPQTTGRRLTLANWIASETNPLTARVFVNRVWQSLMGQPMVATPNDFGLAGSPPEDPILLDWLASEFMRDGWSVKQLVRTIATSATYRQSPVFETGKFAQRLPRRLTAEQLRDALLSVSGLLTDKRDGPPVWPKLPAEVLDSNPAFLDDNAEKVKGWYPSPDSEQYCRSLYLVQKRNTRVPLLETFDLPDNSTPCARREVSTVAPQALTLLNGDLVREVVHALARQVEREAGTQPEKQVPCAFRRALQREPDATEVQAARRLVEQRSLVELCRVLVNLNEFAYID